MPRPTTGRDNPVEIHIPPGPRLGDVVIEAEDLSKGFGDRLLIDDLTFTLPRAGIVGVIGPNGAGKTTLFRMITGAEHPEPDAGTRQRDARASVRPSDMAYVDQSRDVLDDERTVFEEITEGHDVVTVGDREIDGRAYVASFNFKGSDQQKKVGALSGGERNRVHLAKVLKSGGNLLLLDEPTNDLDVDTLRALETALERTPGAPSSSATTAGSSTASPPTSWPSRGTRPVRWFEGNFSDYEAMRRRELGDEADRPHRIKYKPLVR